MLLQPVRDCVSLPVAEQVNGPAGLDVDEDGAVVPAAAEREVVDTEDRQVAGSRVRQRHDQAQHAGPAGCQVQNAGQPGSGSAGQGQRDPGQRACQRRGPPGPPGGQAADLLGEGARGAVRVHAEEPPYPEPDQYPVPADRSVGQPALVGAVDLGGRTAAPRAGSAVGAGACQELHAVAADLGFFHDHGGQVRQQHLEADSVLA
jgi:hypothetical protein